MARLLTLILFSLGVLHASGLSLPRGMMMSADCTTLCASHAMPEAQPEPSCCPLGNAVAQNTKDSDYCPMSNGPCVCGVRPAEDREPTDPMPMPSRDRDTLQMVRVSPVAIQTITIDLPKCLIAVALSDGIHSGFTHNQIQAFLGIWRR